MQTEGIAKLNDLSHSQNRECLVSPDIRPLANLYADLTRQHDQARPPSRLTARGWMLPASSQDTFSGMCGAMSAGRAKYLRR
jgi:hypothetical protein